VLLGGPICFKILVVVIEILDDGRMMQWQLWLWRRLLKLQYGSHNCGSEQLSKTRLDLCFSCVPNYSRKHNCEPWKSVISFYYLFLLSHWNISVTVLRLRSPWFYKNMKMMRTILL